MLLPGKGHNTHYFHHLLKEIGAGQEVQALEEEENTESLVCTVLSVLQELEISKVCYIFSSLCGIHFLNYFFLTYDKTAAVSQHIPESWEFIISQELVLKLLGQGDLLSPEEHLQMFDSPLNIRMDFGKKHSQTFCNPAWVIPGRKLLSPWPVGSVFYLVGQKIR